MQTMPRRWAIRVRGQVQGVGFRPFVCRLARQRGLSGAVGNDGAGVWIEVQGPLPLLRDFVAALRQPPPLACIAALRVRARPLCVGESGFFIAASGGGAISVEMPPDTALCPACRAELFDPANRRWRYPFITCTDCGPRYTISTALPYDRSRTSMAGFVLCAACAGEYHDPDDRRFHAQPNACPRCGPRLRLHDASGMLLAVDDVIAAVLELLRGGAIVALKGLGGFHLACDATNAATVASLRQRKQREAKPFALMAANRVSLAQWVEGDAVSWRLLQLPQRPIVLLRQRLDRARRLPGIAPGLADFGVMLPSTPLQELLFHEAAGRPAGLAWLEQPWPLLLVMSSANPGGEPLVVDDAEALQRLRGIADAFVLHDRAIVARCDDSVVAADGGFVRRARGYVPGAIRLPDAGPAVLALGGFFKNTVCLTRGDCAYPSPHVGTLDNAAACRALEETVAHLRRVLEITPVRIACDRHPDFPSSRLALRYAAEWALPCIAVQHHHAHVAAVVAEWGLRGPVLGLALDGVGLGVDGGLWGGELLWVDGARFVRCGHLRELPLPGGDRAAREPWRMAAAVLYELGRGAELGRWFGERAELIGQMLARGVGVAVTSSAGRVFDAAAALLGVREWSAYEGQAAMELEALACRYGPLAPLRNGFQVGEDGVLDLLRLLDELAGDMAADAGAALLHATLALALYEWLEWAGGRWGLRRVVLSGGCFLNRLLTVCLRGRLEAAGWQVFTARQMPPNDGGLSLGQAWVAMQVIVPDGIQ